MPIVAKGQPTVSVVLTSFNYQQYIGQAIESVLAQDYPEIELLILENCSTDRSPEIIAGYAGDPRVRFIQNETNIGLTCNQNKGIELATGEYIVFLSADDCMLAGMISHLVEFRARHPEIDLTYAAAVAMDGDGRPTQVLDHPGFFGLEAFEGRNECAQLIAHDSFMWFPTTLFPKSVFAKYGTLDERLHVAADYELYIRLAAAGLSFAFSKNTIVAIRSHGENRSGPKHFIASGQQLDEYSLLLEKHIIPETAEKLAGYRGRIKRLYQQKSAGLLAMYPSESANILPKKRERVADIERRIDTIPDIVVNPTGGLRISVIMPSLSELGFLAPALESLAQQEYENWEAVLVCDASPDIEHWLNTLPYRSKITYGRRSLRGGPGQTRNSALSMVKGDVIAYLDEDNRFLSSHLAVIAREFQRDPALRVVRTDAVLCIENYAAHASAARNVVSRVSGCFYDKESPWVNVIGNGVPLNTVAHRQTCIDTVGAFSPSAIGEDWEFLLRLARSFSCHYVREETCEIRIRGDLSKTWFYQSGFSDGFASYGAILAQIYQAYPIAESAALRQEHANRLQSVAQNLKNAKSVNDIVRAHLYFSGIDHEKSVT